MYASKSQNWMWSFDWSDKLPGAQLLLFELAGKNKYKTDVEAFCDYAMGINQSPGGQTHLTEWGSNRHASNLAFICLGVNINNKTNRDYCINNVHFRQPMLALRLMSILPMLINK